MRVTKGSNYKEHAKQIIALGNKFGVRSHDLLFDLYNCLVNKGVKIDPDPKMLAQLKKRSPQKYWVERTEYHKNCIAFESVAKSPLFKALLTKDPMTALEELCSMLKDAHTRTKALKEASVAPIRGKTSGAEHTNNDNMDKAEEAMKAHRKQQAQLQKEAAGQSVVEKSKFRLDNPVELMCALFGGMDNPIAVNAACGRYFPYVLSTDANDINANAEYIIKVAKQFARAAGTMFFDVIKNIGDKGQFDTKSVKATERITKGKTSVEMTDLQELTKANPVDLQRPDIEKRIVKREVVVSKNTDEGPDKAHAIVLLDVSGSMRQTDCALGRMDRFAYALMIVASMMERVVSRGDIFHVILFEGAPLPMETITTQKEAAEFMRSCLHRNNVGGTDIPGAFRLACNELVKIKKYRHADIIIITDCEDQFDAKKLRSYLPGNTKVRGIHVGESMQPEHKQRMFDLCDTAMPGKWDLANNMPALDDVLKGV